MHASQLHPTLLLAAGLAMTDNLCDRPLHWQPHPQFSLESSHELPSLSGRAVKALPLKGDGAYTKMAGAIKYTIGVCAPCKVDLPQSQAFKPS